MLKLEDLISKFPSATWKWLQYFMSALGMMNFQRTETNPTLCNDPCWKLKVSIPGDTKCVSSLPTLLVGIKCPWDCSPGQGLGERLEKPRARFVSQSCELQRSLVLLIAKGQRKVLEAAKSSDFPSCQCSVLPLGSFHLCIPGQHHPNRMLCPGLSGIAVHTRVCVLVTPPSARADVCGSAQGCPCPPGFQLCECGGYTAKLLPWISVSIKIRSSCRLPVINVHYLLFLVPRALCCAALNHADRFLFIFCIMWAL